MMHRATTDSPKVQRHPGGKDGLYRAYCVCGYITGFDTAPHVNRDLQQHTSAKNTHVTLIDTHDEATAEVVKALLIERTQLVDHDADDLAWDILNALRRASA